MSADEMILFGMSGGVLGMLLWGRFRRADTFVGSGHLAPLVMALLQIFIAGLVRFRAVGI